VSREPNDSSSEMNSHLSDSLRVRDGRARCRNSTRPCQGDTVKKGISLELAVIPRFLLVIVVIDVAEASSWQASSSANRKYEFRNNDKWNVIRARIKGSP
jgi:hypothetical protein